MSNGKLSGRLMLKVKACAIIFMASRPAAKIRQIAEAKGISLEEASVMYTIGALKRVKRQGVVLNYAQALDRLEAEQVGDRGSQITKTISADKTAREVARINRINEGEKFSIDGVHYVYDYDNIKTINYDRDQGVINYAVIPHFSIVEKTATEPKPNKVLGTLYAEWEARQQASDPAMQAEKWVNFETLKAEHKNSDSINNIINANLDLFFADYASRLSKTAKRRLYELSESKTDPAYLMSRKGQTDAKTKRESWGAYTLYSGFPHRESISGIEFINLIRQHVRAPVMA